MSTTESPLPGRFAIVSAQGVVLGWADERLEGAVRAVELASTTGVLHMAVWATPDHLARWNHKEATVE